MLRNYVNTDIVISLINYYKLVIINSRNKQHEFDTTLKSQIKVLIM